VFLGVVVWRLLCSAELELPRHRVAPMASWWGRAGGGGGEWEGSRWTVARYFSPGGCGVSQEMDSVGE
jgi:hypothetical protein